MSDWIAANHKITKAETEHNARIATTLLTMMGASAEAIAAMLGNMQGESGINPGAWEGYAPFQGGYGLVQWTPYTKYADWWGDGWENNGDAQIRRIEYEMKNGIQWISTAEYDMSFKEFWKSKEDVRTLAYTFMYNYERPLSLDHPDRKDWAEYWYETVTRGAVNLWYILSKKRRWWLHEGK